MVTMLNCIKCISVTAKTDEVYKIYKEKSNPKWNSWRWYHVNYLPVGNNEFDNKLSEINKGTKLLNTNKN